MKHNIFKQDLERNQANYVPLSPVSFLARSALTFPEKIAVVDGERRFTYREFQRRCLQLAAALDRLGLREGDTVAVLAPNVPAMLEAHYGVPMIGCVLNALNTRLDAATIAFSLAHGEAKLVIVDAEYLDLMRAAMQRLDHAIPVIVIAHDRPGPAGEENYENFLRSGEPPCPRSKVTDEWSAISLGYTSGTTGDPKGVVCHHRGAYLNSLGNALAGKLDSSSVYLWTLPMFHCNGWSYVWAVTAVGGTHVCLRRIEPTRIYQLIAAEGVTHLCAAPIVLNMLIHAQEVSGCGTDRAVIVLTGGSAPPSAIVDSMEKRGFTVSHIYGLTETTGPSLICEWHDPWDGLPTEQRLQKLARQGVNLATLEEARVTGGNPDQPVPADGRSVGEILLRGNTVMMGYLKNPQATREALSGGWFHTGDLAVRHPDGYIEIKDRAKDIVISGGENISTVEIEEVLYRHPLILEAAVVAKPDAKWGERPCAFIRLKDGVGAMDMDREALVEYCRTHLARFKVPKTFVFGELPKTATGKIQKYLLRERARCMGDDQ